MEVFIPGKLFIKIHILLSKSAILYYFRNVKNSQLDISLMLSNLVYNNYYCE